MKRTRKKRSQLLEWSIFIVILSVIGVVWYTSWKKQRFIPVDSTAPASMAVSNKIQTITLRFSAGQDLKQCIDNLVNEHKIKAGIVLSCCGELRKAELRLAGQNGPSNWNNKYEIISISGTLSTDGSRILIALADGKGNTIGGNILKGCMINTSVELVIGIFPDLTYSRRLDISTGKDELVIEEMKAAK